MVAKGNKAFDIDLAYGQSRENALASILGDDAKIEVKSDRQAAITGNVFVEFESRGKPGGIAATESDWWAQEVEPDVWVIMRVDRMKALVKRRLDRYGYVAGGDGKTSKGVLLRRSELTTPIKEEE